MPDIRPASSRKKGRPSEEEREERKATILDAAVHLFIRDGYGQTTVDELASAAQVTKRTIYSYFGDKAAVFTAVVERFRLDSVPSRPAGQEPLAEISARIIHTLHSDQAVGLHRLMISEAAHFPSLAAAFYASGPQGYIESIAAALPDSVSRTARLQVSEAVFGLLLGEQHRKRLLGLTPAPDMDSARKHAFETLNVLGLSASCTISKTSAWG